MLVEYEKMYRTLTADGELTKMIGTQEEIIEMALKKKSKLLQLVALDSITPADFKEMTAQCNAEIKSAEQELNQLRHQEESSAEFRTHMEKVRSTLKTAEQDVANGIVTKDFIDTFIDKIFVTPEAADGSMRLDIRIFSGDATQKYLQKLKSRAGHMTGVCERSEENTGVPTISDDASRTGHTFKKMIEAYERNMK